MLWISKIATKKHKSIHQITLKDLFILIIVTEAIDKTGNRDLYSQGNMSVNIRKNANIAHTKSPRRIYHRHVLTRELETHVILM